MRQRTLGLLLRLNSRAVPPTTSVIRFTQPVSLSARWFCAGGSAQCSDELAELEKLAKIYEWEDTPEKNADGKPMYLYRLKRYAEESSDPLDLEFAKYLYLKKQSVKPNDPFGFGGFRAIELCVGHPGLSGMLEWFLNEGLMDPNKKDHKYCSPLFIAARNGNEQAVRLLLNDSRVQIESVNLDGWTPLMAAVLNNHITVLSMLLNHGANPNHKDNKGRTSLDYAQKYSNPEIMNLLTQNNAKSGLVL